MFFIELSAHCAGQGTVPLVPGKLYEGSYKFLNMDEYTHLLEWAHRIAKRPGVQKGLAAEYQSLGE
ncbi:hypothetical protein [Bacillus sp. B15-48]|uniref:hypothetical protein n=1 Tax=Bacillus sp. B15-48 TaxID=1548601 RepID=UPI00193EDAB4|nr:hypothetical protein [Bacillus sp. B15-48]